MNADPNIPPPPSYRLESDLPTTGAIGELRASARWVAWAHHWDVKRCAWTKVPKNPATGWNASTDNPGTWSTYEAARACQIARGFAGVGIVLTGEDDLIGGDLDKVIINGSMADWARDVARLSETYVEISPSARGLRFLARGNLDAALKCDPAGVELYARGRFLTLTGDHLSGTPDAIRPAPKTLALLQARVAAFKKPKDDGGPKFKINTGLGGGEGDDFFRAVKNAALARLDAWVPTLFPSATFQPGTGSWRVTSRDLGRDLEEDLSLAPGGIQDFGEEKGLTAIDVVMRWGKAADAVAAALWLCEQMGVDAGTLGYRAKGKRADAAPEDGDVEKADGFDLSHDALALDLGLRSWDHNARYVATWSRWAFWAGTHWAKDDALDCMTRSRAYLRKRAVELETWAERKAEAILAEEGDDKKAEKVRAWAKGEGRTLRSKVTVAAVEAMAQSNPRSAARAVDFDADLMILGTPGGTVDLRTGDVRPGRREDMLTKLAAVAPAPPGTIAPLWLAFLDDVFAGDQEVIAFMQRAAGYALTGLTTEHKLLFLYGTGRNGKSVFLDTLQWLLADYARRAAASTFLNSAGERHPTDLAGLHGARLVVGSELPKGKTWDESVIKDLTGGDKMTARFMRQDFFDFTPQLTLMIAGNCQPSFRGVDEAIRARVVLIPFKVTIPAERRDKDLTAKLRAEGPAILRWAIDGALTWQERGLDVPASVAAASADYLDGEDVLAEFLLDCTAKAPGAFTLTSEIHTRFKYWTESQGLGSWSSHSLTKELKSRGFQDARRTHGRGFLDIRMA